MIKYLSLFSGIGAFEKALENLSIPYELVGYCEIDKYASKAYSIIHNVPESLNFGDITLINEKQLPKDIDLVTYGFPCQDISLAGKQKGFEDENAADGTLLIRKLTPKECFRLMGFTDKDVDMLIGHGISNTQLYKMAGNSIVVNVLEFIFCQIFDNNNEIWV